MGRIGLIGTKRGMTQRFDSNGNLIACTVIEVEPNVVTQVKTAETDGYSAIQLGCAQIKVKDERTITKRVTQPLRGHFGKNGIAPRRHLREFRVESTEGFQAGQELTVAELEGTEYVDVIGVSRGKGFAGAMKRHGMRGGPGAHGSGFHRHAGSSGMRSTPGRTLTGQRMAGRMGTDRVTAQNLKVVAIDAARNVILVSGAVPGAPGAMVLIGPAKKKLQFARSQGK
jgi:large subunit ribosomal protein L3